MTHGSLFSGGGGFDLAAEQMGWTNVFHCEIDPFCNRILNHYWPHAKSYLDIRQFDAQPFKGKIDILTGGFPCQPFSQAGKRRGTADNRYLWPEMLRVIREIKPTWVVGENVYGILNWNEGLVFEQVHSDLEAEGYEVQSFVLPATSVNAPHRRNRVWFVAHAIEKKNTSNPNVHGRKWRNSENEKYSNKSRKYAQRDPQQMGDNVTHGNIERLEGSAKARNIKKSRQKAFKHYARFCQGGYWRSWPTQSPVCGGNDGLPIELDGITISRWRKETIRLYGNAVVPQLAQRIFRAIKETEDTISSRAN